MTDTDKLTQAGIKVDRMECGYMILHTVAGNSYILLTQRWGYTLIARNFVKACRTVEEVINLIESANVDHCTEK